MKRILSAWPLLLVTLLGAALRLYKFDSVPPSLNWDEVSHGYNAYSILKTGADEWGIKLPLIFRAYGDYKLPLYIYLTVIPVWFFGLCAFSVRLVSVLAGIFAIPGIYFLANELFKNKTPKFIISDHLSFDIGHLASFLLAITPWHFFISRPALEANLALTLFIYGLYFLFKSITPSPAKGRARGGVYLILALLLLGLTLHTYNTYRILTPLVVLCFILIFRLKNYLEFRNLRFTILISLLFLLPIVFQIVSGAGLARYSKLAILNEDNIYQVGQDRLNSTLPAPLPTLLHNRPVYFAKVFAKNYSDYFSPWFFYQVQGAQYQFAIPAKNMLTLPVEILALVGLIICLFNFRKKSAQFLIILLLLSPVAASLTLDPPQALRPTPMIIPIIILAALTVFKLLYFIHQKTPRLKFLIPILVIYFIGLFSFSFYRYADEYFTDYPVRYASAWQYGYQSAIDYVSTHKSEYDRVFITKKLGEPHEFYAFFSTLDPKIIQSDSDTIRFKQTDWYWTDKINQVYFVNDWDIPNQKEAQTLTLESKQVLPTNNSLLITSVMHQPINTTKLETIYAPDNTPIFIISKFND